MRVAKGGNVLGIGAYGCVVDSYNYDDNDIRKNSVQKLALHFKDNVNDNESLMDKSALQHWRNNNTKLNSEIAVSQLLIRSYPDNWSAYYAPIVYNSDHPLKFIEKINNSNMNTCMNEFYKRIRELLPHSSISRIDKYFDIKIMHVPSINGLSHFDSIRRQRPMFILTPLIFIREMIHILIGIKKMHDLDIIHRDFKPENLMINYNDINEMKQSDESSDAIVVEHIQSKIIDFGFAILLDPNLFTSSNDIIRLFDSGTRGFTPPEWFYFNSLLKIKNTYQGEKKTSDILNRISHDFIETFSVKFDTMYSDSAPIILNINNEKLGIMKKSPQQKYIGMSGHEILLDQYNDFVNKMINHGNLGEIFKEQFVKSHNEKPPLLTMWDVFSIGSTFFELYYSFINHFPEYWPNNVCDKLEVMFAGMMNGNPFERWTIQDSINYLQSLTKSVNQ